MTGRGPSEGALPSPHASASGAVVIGLGNLYRSDDGVGPEVLSRLREEGGDLARWETCSDETTELLQLWEGAAFAVVVDAVLSGSAPGTVHRLVEGEDPIPPEGRSASTHAVALPEVIGLARALGQMPGRLIVYGIEAASFDAGQGLSAAVRARVPLVAQRVLSEVRAFRRGAAGGNGAGERAHA